MSAEPPPAMNTETVPAINAEMAPEMAGEMLMLPAIPDYRGAPLPELYETARFALAECAALDECQQWADKAEALGSYARQAEDESLRKFCDRIQARAIRRCGELLQEIKPHKGGGQAGTRGGAPPLVLTRTQAARDAGLSDDQRKTALRVAAVPADVFEPRVESKTPPTVTQLALLGTTRRQNGRAAEREHHNRALAARAALVRFHHHALPLDPRAFVAALRVEGDELITTYARQAEAWLAAILWELARDDEESGAAQQQDDHTEAS